MNFRILSLPGVQSVLIHHGGNTPVATLFTVNLSDTRLHGDSDTQLARAILQASTKNVPTSHGFHVQPDPHHFDLYLNRLKASDVFKRFKAGEKVSPEEVVLAAESGKLHSLRTSPDDRGNIFYIESPDEITPQTVREAIAWYWSQQHHQNLSMPEHGKHILIVTVEAAGSAQRAWKWNELADPEEGLRWG